MSTPIGRDFKRTGRRQGVAIEFSREFFAGLGVGLLVAVAVFFWQRHEQRSAAIAAEQSARPEPRAVSRNAAISAETDEARTYDFYEMLPNQEVAIPETRSESAADAMPNAPIVRPGSYVLQIGAYRDLEEAERLQTKISRLGVSASIQRIAIDADVFHRVRIGPSNDLAALNRTRTRLRAADIEAMAIRVGD